MGLGATHQRLAWLASTIGILGLATMVLVVAILIAIVVVADRRD